MKGIEMKSIDDVLEEVEVLIDTHFFNEFSETKSSILLKKVIFCQGLIHGVAFYTGSLDRGTPKNNNTRLSFN